MTCISMTPLQIQLAIAVCTSGAPEQFFTAQSWVSPAMSDAKDWLIAEGLTVKTGGGAFQSTERLNAYVDHLCAQSLPVCKWVSEPPEITGTPI